MTKKNTFVIAATSALVALNLSCGTINKENIVQEKRNKTEIVKTSKDNEVKMNYAKFNGKKSITLNEPKIIKKIESVNTKKLREFNQKYTVMEMKLNNNEMPTYNDVCDLKSNVIELINNEEINSEVTFTNSDSIGHIISRSRFDELNEKLQKINDIENKLYGNSKDITEREVNCFYSGHIIPSLIQLNNYVQEINKNEISEEEICKMNDSLIFLKELLSVSNNNKQKLYILDIIKKMKLLLPLELRNENNNKIKENCDLLQMSR